MKHGHIALVGMTLKGSPNTREINLPQVA